MVNVTSKAIMINASPLRMIRSYTPAVGRIEDWDNRPHYGRNGNDLAIEQRYKQIWHTGDNCEVQFLTNHDQIQAQIMNCDGTEYSDISNLLGVQRTYRNLTYRSDCTFKTLDDYLFAYFETGYLYSDEFVTPADEFDFKKVLPEHTYGLLNVQNGDAVRYQTTVDSSLQSSTILDKEAYDSDVKALGYKLNTQLALSSPSSGVIEIIYDHKEYDLYALPLDFSIPTGDYYLRLTFTTGGQSEVYFSEPFTVIETSDYKTDKSLLWEFKHVGEREDEFGFVYDSLNQIRLSYTKMYEFEPGGDIETFNADAGTLSKTRAVPYRVIRLVINQIPNWLADKMNIIFAHDTLIHEGYQFEIQDYGEAESIEGNDLVNYSVSLRQVTDRLYNESDGVVSSLTASFTPDSFNSVDELGDTVNTSFASNVTGDFELIDSPAWITVDSTVQNGDSLSIVVASNAGNEIFRDYTLQYRSIKYPQLIAEVYVNQLQDYTIPANDLRTTPSTGSTLDFLAEGETKRIAVQATGTYTIVISTGFTYTVISPTKVDVTVAKNSSRSTKNGTITFTLDADNSKTSTINLTQDYISAITSVSPLSIVKNANSGYVTVDVVADSGCNWEVIKASSATWISVIPQFGAGTDDFRIVFQTNGGGQRQTSVVVRNVNTSNKFTITVTQQSASGGGGGLPTPIV